MVRTVSISDFTAQLSWPKRKENDNNTIVIVVIAIIYLQEKILLIKFMFRYFGF